MNLVIAGSRDIQCPLILEDAIGLFISDISSINSIISGTATGPDTLGEEWAGDNNISVNRMPADWNKHGKAAGPIRNSEMADVADAALILWDGKSNGTKHMISQMKTRRKPCHVLEVSISYERLMDVIVKVYEYGGRKIIEFPAGDYKLV